MRLSPFRLRTLMIAVATAGLISRLVIHIRGVVLDEDDFALPILMLETVAASAVIVIALAVGCIVRSIRRDDAYAVELRREDIPVQCPLSLDGTESRITHQR